MLARLIERFEPLKHQVLSLLCHSAQKEIQGGSVLAQGHTGLEPKVGRGVDGYGEGG